MTCGLRALLAAAILIVYPAAAGRAVVFDFSMPLRDITATVSPTSITLAVFDPAQNATMVTNLANPTGFTNFNFIIDGGVVAWNNATGYYFTYDPSRTNWVGGTASQPGTRWTPRVSAGIVAWIVYTGTQAQIESNVYDQRRARWMSTVASTLWAAQVSVGFSMSGGSLLWTGADSRDDAVYLVGSLIYDPSRGEWKDELVTLNWNVFRTPLYHRDGVIAWTEDFGYVGSTVYDSRLSRWMGAYGPQRVATRLLSADGVVAWVSSPTLTFQIYDPRRATWVVTNLNTGGSSTVSISNATVHGTRIDGGSFRFGYNPNSGLWQSNITTLPLANFSASTTNGNARLPVYFGDLSIGATRWSWNFGDGSVASTLRSPQHPYLGYRRNNVVLTVTGASGATSQTNLWIQSDSTAPQATFTINDGAAWTSNRAVELRAQANDNSGVVASNRFSNDNLTWSPWRTFSPTNPWALSPGFGPKTVLAQLSDAVGNLTNLGAPILYFTSPPPTVTFVSTNISEAVQRPLLQAVLSKTSLWPVSAKFTLTDLTATYPADYSPTQGPLTFSPGTTAQSFTVSISRDLLTEQAETVQVGFIGLTNAIAGPQGTLTIVDDDGPPVLTQPRRDAAGHFLITVLGDPGHEILVQMSETLRNWVPLALLTNTSGLVEFIDLGASNQSSRVYRALLYR